MRRDERGVWMIPFGIFLLVIGMVFVYLRRDVGMARYSQEALQTAVDAASLAGANQSVQQVTETGPSGEPLKWVYVLDEPIAEDHALDAFAKNADGLKARGLAVDDPVISFPDHSHVDVDVTATYTASRFSNMLQTFFGQSALYQVRLHRHAEAEIKQPNS